MPVLRDHSWGLRYTPDDGDLIGDLYVPLLSCAVRYDRLTGYFTAAALALAARGREGLVLNTGGMPLIVGCPLTPAEVPAIDRGEPQRTAVDRHIAATPLTPLDDGMRGVADTPPWE